MIGTQKITAERLDKRGDREDFLVRVIGPDPKTDFTVPMSITGTALAIWDKNHDASGAAVVLAKNIFQVYGTATLPPKEGFWFDSYNSEETLKGTVNLIYNKGITPFVKNRTFEQIYIRLFGSELYKQIEEIDKFFLSKYKRVFFKSLEEASEMSQIIDDLNNSVKDNANYLYRICILSGIIDHIAVREDENNSHKCTVCGQTHQSNEGTLQAFNKWLTKQVGEEKSKELIKTFQMIKRLRKQYPIHDHYEYIAGERKIRKEIISANEYFGITSIKDYDKNAYIIINKFKESLQKIITSLS